MPDTFVYIGNTAIGKEITQSLAKAGFNAAPDLESASVVFTYCTSQDALETVYFESGGVIAKAKPGAYLVDLSTTTPTFAKELSAMATVSDQHAVEAPIYVRDVTVAHTFAHPENLVAFVGAEKDDAEAVQPLLAAIARTVEMCGAPGMGQLAKCACALNQAAQVVALVESDALCRVTADADTAARILQTAANEKVLSPSVQHLHQAIRDKQFAGSYTVEAMMNELESALTAADDIDLIMPQAESAEYLLQLLSMIGGVEMAPSTLALIYGDEAECAKYGLDWSRAEEAYAQFGPAEDDDDDYDDYDDDDEADGHAHHHHHHGFDDDAFNGGFGGYSSN